MAEKYVHDGWAIEIQDTNDKWIGFISGSNHMTKQVTIREFVKDFGPEQTWAKLSKQGYRCTKVYRRLPSHTKESA